MHIERIEDEKNAEGERESRSHVVGTMQGTPPGRRVQHVGVLDLRGVPAEQVARIEVIHVVNVLLLDRDNRLALERVLLQHVGSVVVAEADERVLVTPQLDISRAALEAIPPGQRLLTVGNLFFPPDAPPALVAEKIETLRVVGTLVAGESVHGALLGKIRFVNGATLLLPDGVAPLTRNLGELEMTPDYLAGLPDGTTFLNLGRTKMEIGLSPDLLRQKIAACYNAGQISGPADRIALLQARCPTNLGRFEIA